MILRYRDILALVQPHVDNVVANSGTGGATFATDDVAGVHYPLTKLAWGPLDTANVVDDAAGKRVPVKVAEAIPAGTNNIGDVDVLTLPALVAGTANIGDVDVLTMPDAICVGKAADGAAVAGNPVLIAGQDGTNAQSIKTDAAGELQVDVLTLPALVAGTANIGDVDVLTLPGVAGDVAHDGVDSGNPVKVGAKGVNALPTAVANNDRTNNISDLFGRVLTGHIDPAMQVHKNNNYTTAQTGTDVWAPAAGKKIAVTSVVLGAYGTTAGRVILWFGDNADTAFTQGTDQVLVAASFAPGTSSKPGLVYTPTVPVFCTTADRELHITTDAALSLDVTVEGYEW